MTTKADAPAGEAGASEDIPTSVPSDAAGDCGATMAIEVVLPRTIASHVTSVLARRGIALDDLVLDLLTRFVPAIEAAAFAPGSLLAPGPNEGEPRP